MSMGDNHILKHLQDNGRKDLQAIPEMIESRCLKLQCGLTFVPLEDSHS